MKLNAVGMLKTFDSLTLVKGYTKTQQTFEFISLHVGKANTLWSERNDDEYVFVIRKGKRIDNTMAKTIQLNPASAKQDDAQQNKKVLVLVQEPEKLTFDGYTFGRNFSFKFRELIATNVVTIDRKGRKVAKRELADYVRQETGNMMCSAEVAITIESAVSEYVDGFMDSLELKSPELCFSMMTKMIKRIEDEVWNVKRIAE